MALLIGYFKLSDDKKAIINRAISKKNILWVAFFRTALYNNKGWVYQYQFVAIWSMDCRVPRTHGLERHEHLAHASRPGSI